MESPFLGVPDVDGWIFLFLSVAAFVTAFIGMVTGTAGGLVLLAFMAIFFTPAVLIPVHTVVQLGSGVTRSIQMWNWVLKPLIAPFLDRRRDRGGAGDAGFLLAFVRRVAGDYRGLDHRPGLDAQARPLMATMIVAGTFGNWAGARALNRMPERMFRIVFQILLTVLALRMLWRAAVEYGLI